MKRLLVFCLSVLLVACTADDSISRDYRCSFVFDTSLHPLPCHLTEVIGNSGHFCKVETYLAADGIRHLQTTRNYDGAKEDITLSTAKESQVNIALGANNCIIVGTNTYDFALQAYDGQCPNCLADYGGYNYPLTWQDNGKLLHCAKCDRNYDVNNGVIADGASGKQLLRYMAFTEGSVLFVRN